jgi:hypothetical protein
VSNEDSMKARVRAVKASIEITSVEGEGERRSVEPKGRWCEDPLVLQEIARRGVVEPDIEFRDLTGEPALKWFMKKPPMKKSVTTRGAVILCSNLTSAVLPSISSRTSSTSFSKRM